MYPFIVKYLGLDSKGVLNEETGGYDESGNVIESVDQQRTFNSLGEMPEHTP
jgi:hypothetical protein